MSRPTNYFLFSCCLLLLSCRTHQLPVYANEPTANEAPAHAVVEKPKQGKVSVDIFLKEQEKQRDQDNGQPTNTKVLSGREGFGGSDLSLQIIPSPEPAAPASLPPFPDNIDSPVTQEPFQKSLSPVSTYSVRDSEIPVYFDKSVGQQPYLAPRVLEKSIDSHRERWVRGHDRPANHDRPGDSEKVGYHVLNNFVKGSEFVKTNLDRARDSLSKNDVKSAIHCYREILYVSWPNEAAIAGLDDCLRRQGTDPQNAKVRRQIAQEVASRSEEEAIVEYRNLVRLEDSAINHYYLGKSLLSGNKIVDGYAELRVAAGRDDWSADQTKELASCHQVLAEVLNYYAHLAKAHGRGTIGMKRLIGAWIESRRALYLDPENSHTAQNLAKLSAEIVAIKPTFSNYLACGSAALVAGNFDKAAECYAHCEKLEPEQPQLKIALEFLEHARATKH